MSLPVINLDRDQYLEVEKIGIGAFAPLSGFMGSEDFHSISETYRLKNGTLFPLPVILDIGNSDYGRVKNEPQIELQFEGTAVATMRPDEFYQPNREKTAKQIFGISDSKHPGVHHYQQLKQYFMSGEVKLIKRIQFDYSELEKTPQETKEEFKNRGWKTVVGFQTRNVPHRAHEYLQKIGLEVCDGLMIQPLIGKKKPGDFTLDSVLEGYRALLDNYFPKQNVLLNVLTTVMRYAGPREAAFHAIVRKNYGCTHFIVGRDHAGVGGYYEKYEAHDFCRKFDDLGIEILFLRGPYLCLKCDSITTDKTCPHGDHHPDYTVEISGTKIRGMLVDEIVLDKRLLRPEVAETLTKETSLFIQ